MAWIYCWSNIPSQNSRSKAHFPLMWGLRNDKGGDDDMVTWLPIIGHLTPLCRCWSVVVVELYTERCTGPAGIWGRDGGWTGDTQGSAELACSSLQSSPLSRHTNIKLTFAIVYREEQVYTEVIPNPFFSIIYYWITCSKFCTEGLYWNYPWIPQIQNNPLLNEWN